MTLATLAEFKHSLVELGLIEAPELERFAAGVSGDVRDLARGLILAGKLTTYQASAAIQGKTKGLVIGQYFVLDKLGEGGMGLVFKAKHRQLGQVVALKILPPSFAKDRDLVRRFRREVAAVAHLKHPNVIAAVDADEDRGVHYLAMDYVDGRDFDRLVAERGPLPVGQALDCIIQSARGLEAAHSAGIIHRDIKPGNLILDDAGTVRVLDLGLARFVEATNSFAQSGFYALTKAGSYMGTVEFMAPEQANDSTKVDGRADIYSLGCTLYFLLTGKEPFEAANVLKRLMAHQAHPAPSLLAVRRDVPEALEEVYQAMMAKRPGDRPSSMAEVVRRLEASRAPTEAMKAQTDLKDFAEVAVKRVPSKARGKSIFARGDDSAEFQVINDEGSVDLDLDLELVEELYPSSKPVEDDPPPQPRIKPASSRPDLREKSSNPTLIFALAAYAAVGLVVIGLTISRQFSEGIGPIAPVVKAQPSPPPEVRVLFDGSGPGRWILLDGKPLPASHVQPDGLNPHGTDGDLTILEEKFSDFVLDVDYKLSEGGQAGVYLRIGDLSHPDNTGIEVAINDTGGTGSAATGGLYGLVPPRTDAQKPAGRWNHMTIKAVGPEIVVNLNGVEVSKINLDEWMKPGLRPDGSKNDSKLFRKVAAGQLPRSGYLGLQALIGDCWFKNITIRNLPPPTPRKTSPRSGPSRRLKASWADPKIARSTRPRESSGFVTGRRPPLT